MLYIIIIFIFRLLNCVICLFRHFAVVGILKMGWKKLFLYNKVGVQSEAMVYCLLDFYIHESRQRKGYGKRLIEYMLKVRVCPHLHFLKIITFFL